MLQKNSDQFKPCCGDCCWFKFEDIEGYGICEKPHGIAKKRQACGCVQQCSDASCKNYISEQQAERYLHVLTEHNKWRRDDNVPNSMPMQDPTEIGLAIDFAVDYIKTFMKL